MYSDDHCVYVVKMMMMMIVVINDEDEDYCRLKIDDMVLIIDFDSSK